MQNLLFALALSILAVKLFPQLDRLECELCAFLAASVVRVRDCLR